MENEKLDFNGYQKQAYSLISEDGKKDMVLNGVLGLAGESGECCDIVKKVRFQGHEMDNRHLMEELGDVLWYVAETASGLGVTLEEVAQFNLDKLHSRYHGETFHAVDSVNRPEYQKKEK
ncbi:MAG: nucleoside triphosphate pyrophosphohydrolase family protein [Bacilli bacterium]